MTIDQIKHSAKEHLEQNRLVKDYALNIYKTYIVQTSRILSGNSDEEELTLFAEALQKLIEGTETNNLNNEKVNPNIFYLWYYINYIMQVQLTNVSIELQAITGRIRNIIK